MVALLYVKPDAPGRDNVRGQHTLRSQVIDLPWRDAVTAGNAFLVGKLHIAKRHGYLFIYHPGRLAQWGCYEHRIAHTVILRSLVNSRGSVREPFNHIVGRASLDSGISVLELEVGYTLMIGCVESEAANVTVVAGCNDWASTRRATGGVKPEISWQDTPRNL